MRNLIALLVLLFVAAAEAELTSKTIQVTGNCRKTVQHDSFKVRMTSSVIDKKSELSAEKSNALYEKLVEFVKTKYPQTVVVKTVEVTTQEERDWQKGKSIFMGYRSRVGIEATSSDSAALSEVIGFAQKSGVTDIGNFESTASATVTDLSRKLCLGEAAQDAFKKASLLAEASKAKLSGLFEMRELNADSPVVMNMVSDASMRKSGPTLEKGQSEIQYSVEAKYSIQ